MSDRARPVPAQVRGDVDRCLHRMEELSPRDEEWPWHIRRLAEACYGLGYDDGHTAGLSEAHTDIRRKQKHEGQDKDDA